MARWLSGELVYWGRMVEGEIWLNWARGLNGKEG